MGVYLHVHIFVILSDLEADVSGSLKGSIIAIVRDPT